jgi:hypothetical protein
VQADGGYLQNCVTVTVNWDQRELANECMRGYEGRCREIAQRYQYYQREGSSGTEQSIKTVVHG